MKQKKQERARGGFTLIEVLLVVAILGILASVVVVNLSGKQEKSMIQAARASIASIATAVDVYEVDTGRFPPNLQALVTSDGSPNWSGPYLRGGLPKDPWGNEFSYTTSEGNYKVTSGGPDRSLGGADDITSF
ncbi:MAG: type II secretion system major pseudopilin GspG [Lentisphaerae bacterium]|nr:type II secretion system major pseudopilin GspG [Lentisphaerota bacterium]